MLESDVYGRQILTSKDGSHAERVKGQIKRLKAAIDVISTLKVNPLTFMMH